MEILNRRVAEVRRRLFIGRSLAAWPWIATAAFGAAAVWLGVDYFRPLGIAGGTVVAVAAGLSLVASGGWAWLTRPDLFHAAMELDRRCGLQERVSSTWALRGTIAQAPSNSTGLAIAAVEADASKALANVDLAAAFPLRGSRRLAMPLAPLAVSVALALLSRPEHSPKNVPATEPDASARADIQRAAGNLEQAIEQPRLEAEKLQLAEAQRLLESIQQQARQMATDAADRKDALVRLNEMLDQTATRQQTTAAAEEVKKQLSRLKSKRTGPAEQLADALGRGDFQDAAEQAERLSKESSEGKLDAARQEELSQQLADLQNEMLERAGRQSARPDASNEQSTGQSQNAGDAAGGEETKSGKRSEAGQTAHAAAVAGRLAGLHELMKQAADGAKNDADAAGQALAELSRQFAQLDRESKEHRLMQQSADALAKCKNGVAAGAGGENNSAALGNGEPTDAALLTTADKNRAGGRTGGLAPGTSTASPDAGPKPEGTSRPNLVDRRVPQAVGTGPIRVVGPAGGANAKGQMLQQIREQAAAVGAAGESQTIDNQPLERARQDQRRQYFDALRRAE